MERGPVSGLRGPGFSGQGHVSPELYPLGEWLLPALALGTLAAQHWSQEGLGCVQSPPPACESLLCPLLPVCYLP